LASSGWKHFWFGCSKQRAARLARIDRKSGYLGRRSFIASLLEDFERLLQDEQR